MIFRVTEVLTHTYELPLAFAIKQFPDEYLDAQELGMTDSEFLTSLIQMGEYGALEFRRIDVQAEEVAA